MNKDFYMNGSPTADGYYTTLSTDEVSIPAEPGRRSFGAVQLAYVTLINSDTVEENTVGLCVARDAVDNVPAFADCEVQLNADESKTVNAILYYGKAFCSCKNVVDVSGNAQIIPSGVVITGDCAIIVS